MADEVLQKETFKEYKAVVDTKFSQQRDEDIRLGNRISKVEDQVAMINELTISVHELASNVANLCKIQEEQGARVRELQERDGSRWRNSISTIVQCVITLIIGFILAEIGMGG